MTSQLQGPECDSWERLFNFGTVIGPHIRCEYWCSFQEAESREISLSCKRLILIQCKINLFNPLPNEIFLDMTKLKAFADNKLNVAKINISLCDRVENTVGKEENAGYQHFLLFPQCLPRPSSLGSLKVRIVW